MSEDIYFTPESKLGIVIRANVDIVTAISSMEHYEDSIDDMLEMIKKHSDLIYEVSNKVIAAERLEIT